MHIGRTKKVIAALTALRDQNQPLGQMRGFIMKFFAINTKDEYFKDALLDGVDDNPRCGTAGCLAGWAEAVRLNGLIECPMTVMEWPIKAGERTRNTVNLEVAQNAQDFLQLTKAEAKALFNNESQSIYKRNHPWRHVHAKGLNPIFLKGKKEITNGIIALENALAEWGTPGTENAE